MLGLLTLSEAAEYLGTTEATMRYLRFNGEGPRSAKLRRRVVYRKEDLDDWVQAQLDEAEKKVRDDHTFEQRKSPQFERQLNWRHRFHPSTNRRKNHDRVYRQPPIRSIHH